MATTCEDYWERSSFYGASGGILHFTLGPVFEADFGFLGDLAAVAIPSLTLAAFVHLYWEPSGPSPLDRLPPEVIQMHLVPLLCYNDRISFGATSWRHLHLTDRAFSSLVLHVPDPSRSTALQLTDGAADGAAFARAIRGMLAWGARLRSFETRRNQDDLQQILVESAEARATLVLLNARLRDNPRLLDLRGFDALEDLRLRGFDSLGITVHTVAAALHSFSGLRRLCLDSVRVSTLEDLQALLPLRRLTHLRLSFGAGATELMIRRWLDWLPPLPLLECLGLEFAHDISLGEVGLPWAQLSGLRELEGASNVFGLGDPELCSLRRVRYRIASEQELLVEVPWAAHLEELELAVPAGCLQASLVLFRAGIAFSPQLTGLTLDIDDKVLPETPDLLPALRQLQVRVVGESPLGRCLDWVLLLAASAPALRWLRVSVLSSEAEIPKAVLRAAVEATGRLLGRPERPSSLPLCVSLSRREHARVFGRAAKASLPDAALRVDFDDIYE